MFRRPHTRIIVSILMVLHQVALFDARGGNSVLPKAQRYYSENGLHCVEVRPRNLEGHERFWREKYDRAKHPSAVWLDSSEPAAEPELSSSPCKAIVFARDEVAYKPLREFTLRNEVAPLDVLVGDDGEFIVTLDDWGMEGYGTTTVVIYRSDGSVVQALGLDQFLTVSDTAELRHDPISTRWRDGAFLDPINEVIVLPIYAPRGSPCIEPAEVRISLHSGEVLSPLRDLLPHTRSTVEVLSAHNYTPSLEALRQACGDVQLIEFKTVLSQEVIDQATTLQAPEYVELMRVAEVSAVVPLDIAVDAFGRVVCAAVEVKEASGFGDASIEAAYDWRFQPGVPRIARVLVRFEAWLGCNDSAPKGCKLTYAIGFAPE